jgi:predicted nucleic acid-binding protein
MVALFNEQDSCNQQVVQWENEYGDDYQFVTTHAVIQEIYQLLLARVGNRAISEFLKCVKEGWIQVLNLPGEWTQKAINILERFLDKTLDFADISIVILADLVNLGDILTVDRKDFAFLRWGNGKNCFNNLLYPL